MIGQNCWWQKFFEMGAESAFGPDGLDLPTLQQSEILDKSEIPQYLIDELRAGTEGAPHYVLMMDFFRTADGEIISVVQKFSAVGLVPHLVKAYSLECSAVQIYVPETPPEPLPVKPAMAGINTEMLAIVVGVVSTAVAYWLYVR